MNSAVFWVNPPAVVMWRTLSGWPSLLRIPPEPTFQPASSRICFAFAWSYGYMSSTPFQYAQEPRVTGPYAGG